jgi:hypothetical protein
MHESNDSGNMSRHEPFFPWFKPGFSYQTVERISETWEIELDRFGLRNLNLWRGLLLVAQEEYKPQLYIHLILTHPI